MAILLEFIASGAIATSTLPPEFHDLQIGQEFTTTYIVNINAAKKDSNGNSFASYDAIQSFMTEVGSGTTIWGQNMEIQLFNNSPADRISVPGFGDDSIQYDGTVVNGYNFNGVTMNFIGAPTVMDNVELSENFNLQTLNALVGKAYNFQFLDDAGKTFGATGTIQSMQMNIIPAPATLFILPSGLAIVALRRRSEAVATAPQPIAA